MDIQTLDGKVRYNAVGLVAKYKGKENPVHTVPDYGVREA